MNSCPDSLGNMHRYKLSVCRSFILLAVMEKGEVGEEGLKERSVLNKFPAP